MATIAAQNTTVNVTVTEGKRYGFRVAGTFGSGTVTLSWNDGTNTVAYPSGAFTAAGGLEILAMAPTLVVAIGTATNPVLTYSIFEVL